MFGKCPKRITVFSSAPANWAQSANPATTAAANFTFMFPFKLEHQLQAKKHFIKLVIAKLQMRRAKIRPSVNIVGHQLDGIAANVVVQAGGDGMNAVVSNLTGF